MVKLADVVVQGEVTHGSAHKVYTDNQIKDLLVKKPGAYGRHWVYGNRLEQLVNNIKDGVIVVTYGTSSEEHITFVGRSGLKDCLAFLSKFDAK